MSDSHETMEEAFRALQLALEQSRNINMFTMEIPVCEVDIEGKDHYHVSGQSLMGFN